MPDEIKLQHDGEIDIATGKHRRELKWRNRSILWSELLNKLSATQRTHETYKEYLASKKSRQDEIKDVGGFVGAYLQGGRRKHDSVQHRQLITLDIDFAKPDVWEDFKEFDYPGISAAIYSTHKHSDATPRYRLLIPLNRPVLPDEYVAIARRIAGNIGIDQFDHTTYQPERLMYWPSTAKDGDYVFDYTDGDWLDADAVLATYHNWQDSSEWPVSDKESDVVIRTIKKQGDPLEKPGIIGAFCRTYSIHDVIEKFLSDVYEPCDAENRYTYKEGSTAAGLITYDDKFAYSHHGTDPVSGKLCNAFDLVRIHLFGLKDEDVREDTATNKRPSFIAMQDFAANDGEVRKALVEERLADAQKEFENVEIDFSEFEGVRLEDGENEEPEDAEWLKKMDVDKRGIPSGGIDNIVLILDNDKRLKGIAYDEFERQEIITKRLPWQKEKRKYFKDSDVANLKHFLKINYSITCTTVTLEDALQVIYEKRKINVVKNYLQTAEWDGRERIESLFIDYLGAENSDYVRQVTRKSIVACAARIFKPGIKFDNVCTFVGPEGIGKSTLLDKLGGEWFSDSFSFSMLGTKEANEQLQGVWILEIAELTGLRKADQEAAKSFLSRREDRYRVSYGRRLEHFPRQCVPFGSTNKLEFLKQVNGNRRFWPIRTKVQAPTKSVFKDLTAYEISQIWAEAVTYFNRGEQLKLTDEMELYAKTIQEEHTETDEREGIILNYLDKLLPTNWDKMNIYQRREFLQEDDEGISEKGTVPRTKVCVAEIWCEVFNGKQSEMNVQNTKFIRDILQKADGWYRSKGGLRFGNYGIQRGYERVASVNTAENNLFTANNC